MGDDHGFLSLLPPLVALVLALVSKNVILSLSLGVLGGFLVLSGGNPLLAVMALVEQGLVGQLASQSHVSLVLLVLVIGGFVGLLDSSGGMRTFALRIAAAVRGAVGAQLAVWLAGLGIFFSDSASPLILGPIFRPVMARVGVSREKLAYIIDSTASPVCVLVPFISWGVYVMSLIDQGYGNNGIQGDSFAELVALLPLQFYPILALLAVPMFILTGRDWGPMAAATAIQEEPDEQTDDHLSAPPPLLVITVPMLTLALSVIGMFAASHAIYGSLTGQALQTSLILAYLTASAYAVVVLGRTGIMARKEALAAFRHGIEKMLLIPLILVLAWSLGHACKALGTGAYLARVSRRFLTAGLLSPLIFVAGAMISFAMGSAWGTFAILMPIAISIAHGMGIPIHPPMAAVLSGGLFGDHASPISDTTILASMGAGCRHIDHVRTQLPYALVPAVITAFCFWLAGTWQSGWLLGLAGLTELLVIVVLSRLFGR